MNKLKILHVIAGGQHGGAETFCLDAICALDDAGISQHVICRPHAHYMKTLNDRSIPFDTMSFSRIDKLWRGSSLIKKCVRDVQPSIIHAWMGRAASFVPSGLPVPVLGWFGGYYDLKRYRSSDFYMGVTKDIVRYIGEQSAAPERAFLVHTFGTLEQAPPVNRSDFSTPEDAPVVLLLSRMHAKKGVDTLLQAATQLPGVYFWLAGDGPDLEKYKQQCKELGLDERVRFLGWRDDRAALLAASDICALPSRYEPFGTVMAEAWYMGVPLVAAKAAGPLGYVEDGKNGLLCEIDDSDGLAAKIKMILDDQSLRQSLIQNGHITCNTSFSREATSRSLIDAYSAMVAAGKR